jgi:predicted nucleic acid-binding protein
MVLSVQGLTETYSVMCRLLVRGPELLAIRQKLKGMMSLATAPFDADNLPIAWALHDRFQTSWWDALMLSSAVRARCDLVLSEDLDHGRDYLGTTVLNPFRLPPEALSP